MNDVAPCFFIRPLEIFHATAVEGVALQTVGRYREKLMRFVHNEKSGIFKQDIKIYGGF